MSAGTGAEVLFMQALRSSFSFAIEFKFIPGTNFDGLKPIKLVDTANENPQSVEESNFDFSSIHQCDQQHVHYNTYL